MSDKTITFLRNELDVMRAKAVHLMRENKTLTKERDALREALKKIAGIDYRGNRSTESYIAFEALKDKDK